MTKVFAELCFYKCCNHCFRILEEGRGYQTKASFSGRKETLGCVLHKSPKSYNDVFLLVGLTTLGTFIEFLIGWFVHLVGCLVGFNN